MLILVRHGRTTLNADGLLQGRIDAPLDEVGRAQAAEVGARLASADRVISSPLQRAVDTAATIGLPVDIDERFIELDYGDLDGTPVSEIAADTWAVWRASADYRPPGGETLREMGERVSEALDGLVAEATERDVVVVSHVSPVKAAVAWALDASIDVSWRSHLDPASITRIGFRAGHSVLLSFNEVSHLR